METITEDLKIKIINKLMPIKFFIRSTDKKVIRCPFHSDRSPSAEIFEKDNVLWCFTCGRFFYPINFIHKHKLNINDVYTKLQSFNEGQDLVKLYEESLNKTEVKQEPKSFHENKNQQIVDFTINFFTK